MKPIIFDADETTFASNGLGRLNECIDLKVTEGKNSVFEADFSYPVDGANFDLIQPGRIIYTTHDETRTPQPFDIVSFDRPMNGVVTFHAEHISYRQRGLTVAGSGINSLAAAFALLETAEPNNPFTYWTDITSTAYMAAADGTPRSVRQLLGGVEGSILDAYGGEYEWDKFLVKLWSQRGQARDFTIRYGVNLLDYNESTDYAATYSACVPYWKGAENGSDVIVTGARVDLGGGTYSGRNVCVPLDLSDKFETAPTSAQLQTMALHYMQTNQPTLPAQTININFVRLQELGYDWLADLMRCSLCDTIKVEFPRYGMSGNFKIVKTVWNALEEKYESMELGQLSPSLSEALGISNSLGGSLSGGSVSIDAIYPVGSIYMSVNNINPSLYFENTTWVQIKDSFLLAAGDTYTGGSTGGKASHAYTPAGSATSHVLTVAELPAHYHAMHYSVSSGSLTGGYQWNSSGKGAWSSATESSAGMKGAGSGSGHTHGFSGTQATIPTMPPYLVVYIWQRTA